MCCYGNSAMLLQPFLVVACNIGRLWNYTHSPLWMSVVELAEPHPTVSQAALVYLIFSLGTPEAFVTVSGGGASISRSSTINFGVNLLHSMHSHEGLSISFCLSVPKAVRFFALGQSRITRAFVTFFFQAKAIWRCYFVGFPVGMQSTA